MKEMTSYARTQNEDKITAVIVKKICSAKFKEGTEPKRPEWHKYVYANKKK